MKDHPEHQTDFEKLQFALAYIKQLQRQNLKFYDEVLQLQDENDTLYKRIKELNAEHASEKQELTAQLAKALQLDNAALIERNKDVYVVKLKKKQKENEDTIASLRKQLNKVRNNLVRFVMKERSSKLGEA